MKIVYASPSGAMAAVAAALHLGRLAESGPIRPREIASVPYFAGLGRYDHGFHFSCGRDSPGNEVLITGYGNKPFLVERAARAAVQLAGRDDREWQYVDCRFVAGIPGAIVESVWLTLCGPGRGALLLARIISWWYRGLAELARRTRDRNVR
jgi:hypothetical protein